METQEKRRKNRLANITAIAVFFLFVFELIIMSGGLELKSATVAKYAPWAYDSFLRLVGENSENVMLWKGRSAETNQTNKIGFDLKAMPFLVETNQLTAEKEMAVDTNDFESIFNSEIKPASTNEVETIEPVG
jgi:hypothetical protein